MTEVEPPPNSLFGSATHPGGAGAIELGTRLSDRYRLTEVAGLGGMAIVYKAADERSGDIVAVKMLRRDMGHAGGDERLMREATLGARLDHPNCVGVIDSGEVEGAPYLVMEYVEGQLLRDYLHDVGARPWREALEIAAHLLRGLAHAHDRGVLHRDIKPENIVLTTRDGDVRFARLIDFGISKILEGYGADPNLTATGIIIGTPRYLSPEQAVGGAISPATDLYALTCVLFELLTGQPPFDGDDLVQLVTAHAMTPPPDPREIRPEMAIPEAVARLVATGLRKRADERPPSAAAFLAEVERLLDRAESEQAPTATAPAPPGRAALPRECGDRSTARPPEPPLSSAAPPLAVPQAPRAPRLGTPPPAAGAVVDGAPHSRGSAAHPGGAGVVDATADTAFALPRSPGWSRRYWQVSALFVALAGIAAVVVVTGRTGAGGSQAMQPIRLVLPTPPPDPELVLKAGLHDLANGNTCAARLAAVKALHKLGDKRAVSALKRARTRIRGGFLGFGGQNTNQCLRAAADEAIRALDPEASRPSRTRK